MALIFLIGMPGSGKTTLGKMLALELGYRFVDTDVEIEKEQGLSIPEIFSKQGEDSFRSLEAAYIMGLGQEENLVVSTGGGLPCFHGNMAQLSAKGLSVYLKVSVQELLRRLGSAANAHRPLVAGKTEADLRLFLEGKLMERESYYQKAKVILEGDQLSLADLLKAVQ